MIQKEMQCDECGRFKKIHRKYKELKFCAACYKRTFLKAPCPKCHTTSRLYTFDKDAVCITCERARPCIRCGEQDYKIGQNTRYGRVCQSCSTYFREPKACSKCGELSRRLSAYKKYGELEPICPRCANKHRGTCNMCKRHRDLISSKSGELLCKTCNALGMISCPSCNEMYPSGYGKQCVKCYYSNLFKKRKHLNMQCITTHGAQNLYEGFATWVLRTYKIRKAVIVINAHIQFFLTLDAQWGKLPDKVTLLHFFGAEGLRHHRTVIKFLSENHLLSFTEHEKRTHSNITRIKKMTDGFSGTKEASLILSLYCDTLLDEVKTKTIQANTARFYASSARTLLSISYPVTNNSILEYLNARPGQLATVSRFIVFLKKNWGLNLQLPTTSAIPCGSGTAQSKQKLIKRLQRINIPYYKDKQALALALLYFHGVPTQHTRKMGLVDTASLTSNGINVSLEEYTYWLPKIDVTDPVFFPSHIDYTELYK